MRRLARKRCPLGGLEIVNRSNREFERGHTIPGKPEDTVSQVDGSIEPVIDLLLIRRLKVSKAFLGALKGDTITPPLERVSGGDEK